MDRALWVQTKCIQRPIHPFRRRTFHMWANILGVYTIALICTQWMVACYLCLYMNQSPPAWGVFQMYRRVYFLAERVRSSWWLAQGIIRCIVKKKKM
jgi:hypothetical protein